MEKRPVLFIMTLLLVALVVIVVFLVRTDPFGKINPAPANQSLEVPKDDIHAGELAEAMKTFGQTCASCHGNFGQGQAGYPPLQKTTLSEEEIKSIIKNGKGEMPAFNHIKEPLLSKMVKFIKML